MAIIIKHFTDTLIHKPFDLNGSFERAKKRESFLFCRKRVLHVQCIPKSSTLIDLIFYTHTHTHTDFDIVLCFNVYLTSTDCMIQFQHSFSIHRCAYDTWFRPYSVSVELSYSIIEHHTVMILRRCVVYSI